MNIVSPPFLLRKKFSQTFYTDPFLKIQPTNRFLGSGDRMTSFLEVEVGTLSRLEKYIDKLKEKKRTVNDGIPLPLQG
jgi:hypothetical protein